LGGLEVDIERGKTERMTRREVVAGLAGSFWLSNGQRATTAPAKRPNILFAIADDWGSGHAGAYGCEWIKTPAFDRIAKTGVLFRNTFTSNPKCSPCRASILTGRNTWQCKEAVNHQSIFPRDLTVYPDVLEKAGYVTGCTGKGWGPGDYTSTGWPHNPAGKEWNTIKSPAPTSGISPIDYAANFAAFLREKPNDKPFCFWLGGHEPHRPYEPGSGARAGKTRKDVQIPPYLPDNAIVRDDLLDYGLEVEWFDQHVGRALKHLEEIGQLENTLIVMTSDHGMPFPRVKGQIFEDGFHIPLAICWGQHVPPGRVIDDFINVRDFAPTFLEAAGVMPTGTMTGMSFLPLLTSQKSGRLDPSRDEMLIGKERHDIGRPNDAGYPVRAIRTPEFLYVKNFEPERWPAGNPETGYTNVDDGPTKQFMLSRFDNYYELSFGKRPMEELYLVAEDPHNMKNLAADPKFAETKRKLRERMEERLRGEGDPRMLGHADFFDTIEYTAPKTHSYAEWLKHNGTVR
jgi:N-sulfoglucosamine sulfohydrolase